MIRILVFLILISSLSHAQITLKGKIINANDQQPIAYCNIGIVGTAVGTISNYDGTFELNIPQKLSEQPVIFSAIGFERIELKVAKSKSDLKIELKEKATLLKSIDVYASKRTRKKWLGNKKKDLLPSGTQNYDSASAGGAIALLIVKEDPRLKFVQEARLRILRNTLPEFKVRVRVLNVDHSNNGLPGEDLLKESFVITSSIRKGWLTFDLREKNLMVESDSFFIEFEWIFEDKDRQYIATSYDDFIKNNPDKVSIDTVIIDNMKIPELNVKDYIVGTFFAVTVSEAAREAYITYDRSSSFSDWIRSPSIVQAKVLMSD